MKYKAILSDLDKTLIEDVLVPKHVVAVVEKYLKIPKGKAGAIVEDFYAIQTSKAHFLNGYTKVGAWKKVLHKHVIPYNPTTIYELNTMFWETAASYARPYAGVLHTIHALKKMGYLFAIVSGGDYMTRFLHLEKTGILPFTDILVTTEQIGNVKHEENLYREAARELGVKPSEAVAIGDHEVADIVLPKKDGFTTVRISQEKIASEADYIIPTFSDLLEIVKKN